MRNILATQRDLRQDDCAGHVPKSLEHRGAGVLERHAEDLSVQLKQAPMMKRSQKDALELLLRLAFVHKFDQSICVDEQPR